MGGPARVNRAGTPLLLQEVGTEQVTAYGPGETFQAQEGTRMEILSSAGYREASWKLCELNCQRLGCLQTEKSGQHTAWTGCQLSEALRCRGLLLGSRE